MFEEVIAGIDGTSNGRDAAVLASKLVAPGGTLTLVHVHGDDTVFRYGSSDFAEIARQDSLELLAAERVAAEVEAGVETVGASSVGAGLHRAAEERGADLLVVGSSSRGLAGRLLLGDDMRASLEGAPCTVAIAPRGYAGHASPLATIGVAYDGSVESEAALEVARGVAREHRSKVAALTVVNVPTYPYGAMAALDWSDVLDDLRHDAQTRLEGLGDVEGHAVQGVTTEEVAKFAEQVDLLVLGSRGYGPARRMLFGSTSDYMARHAHCPLVVLRSGVELHADSSSGVATGARA